ncbi:hypothetical protein QGM71_12505 [Virgibacillus sp. C22-A2]|uniref:Uncharacterized protein n=1 Tax=Virgibacillus tibetensis TaxID=3042313 RepID=A0ABU6KGM9_9BACI|nr:hypothetical protein [Virgibacillus sp. C22-A2]
MDVREKCLENIYMWEREEEQREYYIEDLENQDELTDSLVDKRVNEVYDFDLALEVWCDL